MAGLAAAAEATRALAAAALNDVDWDLLFSYAGLLSLATFSIYAGARSSVPRPKTPPASDVKKDSDSTHEDEDDDEDSIDRMSADDAWLFPIIGSVALVGLYTMVTYFGEQWINWLLGWYFALAGVGSVWNSSISLTRYLLGEARWKSFDKLKVSVKHGSHVLVRLSMRTPSVILLPFALVPSGLYTFWSTGRRSILLTDLLALSFAHNALSLIKLDSFRTGVILLSGLFVYDVWWVFGTEVMVKVATTVDGPIKLLWPKSITFGGGRGYTMLGLGDVVIPGTFVGQALRYDFHCRKGPGPYFYSALGGYIVGLFATMMVMHVFGRAQPALLYLSPGCILSFVGAGLGAGELVEAWKWIDS